MNSASVVQVSVRVGHDGLRETVFSSFQDQYFCSCIYCVEQNVFCWSRGDWGEGRGGGGRGGGRGVVCRKV